MATFRGDHRFNDTIGPYDFLSDEYGEAMYDLHKRYLARLLEAGFAGAADVAGLPRSTTVTLPEG